MSLLAAPLNNTTYPICTPEQDHVRRHLKFAAYFVITPIHLCIGLPIHIFCLWALAHRGKNELGYNYQTFVIASEACEIILTTLGSFARHWCSDSISPASWWCSRNYPIMVYGGRLSIPFLNAFATIRLLLSVSMTIERIFAMRWPFAYRSIQHKKHQAIAVVTCVVLGIGTSVFDVFRNILIPDSDDPTRYRIITDDNFVESTVGIGLACLRTVLRMIGMVLLVICNVVVIRLYRAKVSQAKLLTRSGQDEREKQKRANEKTLMILTVVQSFMTFIETGFYVTVYVIIYVERKAWPCRGQLLGTCLDIIVQVTTTGNLYVAILFSKPFRQLVIKAIKRQHWDDGERSTIISRL